MTRARIGGAHPHRSRTPPKRRPRPYDHAPRASGRCQSLRFSLRALPCIGRKHRGSGQRRGDVRAFAPPPDARRRSPRYRPRQQRSRVGTRRSRSPSLPWGRPQPPAKSTRPGRGYAASSTTMGRMRVPQPDVIGNYHGKQTFPKAGSGPRIRTARGVGGSGLEPDGSPRDRLSSGSAAYLGGRHCLDGAARPPGPSPAPPSGAPRTSRPLSASTAPTAGRSCCRTGGRGRTAL